jgi:uncharacterized protein (DUF58 family)
MELIIVAAVIFLCFFLIQKYYQKRWDKGIFVKMSFDKKEACIGDVVGLEEVVANGSSLILPFLHLKYELSRYLKTDSEMSDRSYRDEIFSLMFRQKVTRQVSVECTKRGLYRLQCVDMIFPGFFGNQICNARFNQQAELLVFPELVDVSGLELANKKAFGDIAGRRRIYEDNVSFRGIRQYAEGDELSKINWKATAKERQLMVNCYEDMRRKSVVLLLDIGTGTRVSEYLQETAISIAASLALDCEKECVPVTLISNGKDCVTGNCVNDTGKNIYRALARIDTKQTENTFSLTGLRQSLSESSIILISASVDSVILHQLESLAASESVLWVCVEKPQKKYQNKNIERVLWEVVS